MDRSDIERAVASHYGRSGLAGKILKTLGLQDAAPGSVPIEALFPVDQLHHGGVDLTEKMASAAGVRAGMKVLDAGSGIGGSARFLAGRFDCDVDALDLSPDYVRTAEELDRIVGLPQKIRNRAGSVLDLPFEANSFDMVWSQNVTMNVADKQKMFSEAFRVLRSKGVYVLTHIGGKSDGAIDYPLPWATTDATSFITSPSEFVQTLSDAGFQDVQDHAKDAPPPAPPSPAAEGEPDDSLAMGDQMSLRRANLRRAASARLLVPMLVTAVKP
ncbi:class I SAM-dependent methyltransferase [Hoeflea sp. CAU 1731]